MRDIDIEVQRRGQTFKAKVRGGRVEVRRDGEVVGSGTVEGERVKLDVRGGAPGVAIAKAIENTLARAPGKR